MKLIKNVIFYDRVLKLFVGSGILIYSTFWLNGYLQIGLRLFSLIPLGVAISGSCPLYKYIGFCLVEKRSHSNTEKIIIGITYILFISIFLYFSLKYSH